MATMILAVACHSTATGKGDGRSYAKEFTVVDLDSGIAAPRALAVEACAGLYNRRLGGSVYVRQSASDEEWLSDLGLAPNRTIDASAFLTECTAQFPQCVRYSYVTQHALLPSILTAGTALDAVPLDVSLATSCQKVALDATTAFADATTPYLATKYVFEHYVSETTGLAMLNPGYDEHAQDQSNPPLDADMSPALVDFVFSQKLFVVFLINGCTTGNPEQELLSEIVNAGHWATPLPVYGYNDTWLVGGFLYEAQTRCLDSRNMGAIASMTGNLSFFSTRRPDIRDTSELEHNPPENVTYDPTKNYVAFIVGDGDNVGYIMTSRKEWLSQRLEDCADPNHACAPLTWSISPHLPHLAPDVLKWYYASSRKTGRDYFTLPPSGYLYAYPTSMFDDDQDRFVAATEDAARILGVHGVVHWDMFDSWRDAESSFLPKYASGGVIQGIFPVNVPYPLEMFPWWPDSRFYEVLRGKNGSKSVLFRPREWRGVDDSDDRFTLDPQRMADELGAYPPGTVTWVYMTSDGGLNLQNSFMALEKVLPANVQLVSADEAAKLALAAGAR